MNLFGRFMIPMGFRLSILLTLAFLFNTAAFAADDLLLDLRVNNRPHLISVLFRQGPNDYVWTSNENGAANTWVKRLENSGPILAMANVWKATGQETPQLPARVKLFDNVTPCFDCVAVITEDEISIINSHNGRMTFTIPGGTEILGAYWDTYKKVEGQTLSFLSIKTNEKTVTTVYHHEAQKFLQLNHNLITLFEDFRVVNNEMIFGSSRFPLDKKAFAKFADQNEAFLSAGGDIQKVTPSLIRLNQAAEKIKATKIMVVNEEGTKGNAWTIVKAFARDLSIEKIGFDTGDFSPNVANRIEAIYESLLKKEIGSVKILGPAGAGKTTLVKQLIADIAAGAAPEELTDTAFFLVDPAALAAGTKYVGSQQIRINAMLELSRRYKIVWVIDEVHTLRGMGTHSQSSVDILQMLKPGLTEGYFRMIGMSTSHEWNHAFANDPAFDQRFSEVRVDEPPREEVLGIVSAWTKKHSLPEISSDILNTIIDYSNEFSAIGLQPRKSILLVEQIFASLKRQNQLRSPTIEDVKYAAQRLYNINPDHFNRDSRRAAIRNLPTVLDANVIGQDIAKQAIFKAAAQAFANTEDKLKPKARKIFAGPKGQGKTEIVMATGKALNLPVARIVMTKYTSAHQTTELKREISQALRSNAFTILFFDEIEKAHPSIQKDLLDLLDSGKFTVTEKSPGDSLGISVEVNARNAYALMATNAGAEYIDSLKSPSDYNEADMKNAMERDGLSELVIDRMDGIVPFFHLTKEQYRKVVIKNIRSIIDTYKKNNPETKLRIENIRGYIDSVVERTYHEKMSNRQALTELSESLRSELAIATLESENEKIVNVKLQGERNRALNYCKNRLGE